MRLPKLDDLLEEQKDVYFRSDSEHLFAVGPPGSGKTTLAVLRAKFLCDQGKSVILMTRNRMLAALASEIGGGALSTVTMHKHLARDYSIRFQAEIPKLREFEFDWQQALQTYAAGGVRQRLDHIVIDEGQNLPPQLFTWAVRFGARTVSVFADEDQATDKQRSSLSDICDAGLPDPIRLTHNHRNTPEIARVAEYFHRSSVLPPSLIRRAPSGEIPHLWTVARWEQLAEQVATRFLNRGESIGVVVQSIDDARTVWQLMRDILPESARVSLYTRDSGRGAEFGIRLLDPGVTVLTGQSVIGLEFDAVFLQDLGRSLPCVAAEHYRRMYMLCARARNSLTLVNGITSLSAAQLAALPPARYLSR